MARNERTNWSMPVIGQPGHNCDHAQLAMLMDIRNLLDQIAESLRPLRCHNFLRIPRVLDKIQLNTKKRPRKKPLPKPV